MRNRKDELFLKTLIESGIDQRTSQFIYDIRKALYEADEEPEVEQEEVTPDEQTDVTKEEEEEEEAAPVDEETTEEATEEEEAAPSNPVDDTINHYNETQTLLKTDITDRIVKDFMEAQTPELQSNGNIIIEKKLYISPASMQGFLTKNYNCSEEQATQLLDIFVKRDFLTKTSRLRVSDEQFSGAADSEYYMMLPEAIEKYNAQ